MGLACPGAAGLYPLAEGTYRTTRNDAAFRFADDSSKSGKIGVSYARPSLGTLTLFYEYTSDDRPTLRFTNRIDQVGATFHRAVAPRISFDLGLSYLDARSVGLAERPYRGVGWDAAVTIRPTPRWTLRAASDRTIVNDSLIPAAFAVQSSYDVRLEYGFARTRLWAGGQLGGRDFRDDPRVIASPYRRDRFRDVYGGFERQIAKRVAITGEIQYFARRTDSHVNEYNDTLATIGAKLTY